MRTFTRPPLPTRTTLVVSTIAVGLLTNVGCGATNSNNAWKGELHEYLSQKAVAEADNMTGTLDEACPMFALFGLDTPEAVGNFMFAFEEDDLFDPDTTVGEVRSANLGGDVPDVLPDHVTMRDLAEEAGAWFLDRCDIDY